MVRIEIPEDQKRPEIVREALRGKVPRFPPSLALDVVPDLDVPEAERRDILREALRDAGLEPHVRVAAIQTLGRVGPEEAVPELVELLAGPDGEDEEFAGAAVSVLGRLGGPDQLEQIERVKNSARSDLGRRRAAFAEALIVYRNRLTDREVELPPVEEQPEPEPTGALTFISRRPGRDRRRRALEGLRREFPSIDPSAQDVHELQCGPRLMEVILDQQVTGPDGLQSLTERPALPAVVSFRSEETADFYPALLAFTTPQGGADVSLLVTRLEGAPMFSGKGSIEAGGAEAELRSVNTPGVPAVSARIRVTGRGFEITGISEVRAPAGDTPQQMDRAPG
jgi:HEAT repeats